MRRIVHAVAIAAVACGVLPTVFAEAASASVDGTFSVLAGGGVGDGQPATSVYLQANAAAHEPNGDLLLVDSAHQRVRRVDHTTGLLSTVAGIGEGTLVGKGSSGDGGPATAAGFINMRAIARAANGDIYVTDTGGTRVRRIDAVTGDISLVAGSGTFGMPVDTDDATTSPMQVMGITVNDTNGDVYLGDWNDVVSVLHPDGSLERFAGSGTWGEFGDGGPAKSADLINPWSTAVLPDGDVLVDSGTRIRRVDSADGTISTVAGGGATTDLVDGDSPTSASIAHGNDHLAIGPTATPGDSVVYFTDGSAIRTFTLHADGTEGPVATLPNTSAHSCSPWWADTTTLVVTCGGATYDVDLATLAMTRVAGIDPSYRGGDRTADGVSGPDASFSGMSGVAAFGGDVYLASSVGLIYRIGSDGVVHRFAGTEGFGPADFPASGTPLLSANLAPQRISAAPGGGLYIEDCVASKSVQCMLLLAHDGVLDQVTSPTLTTFTDGMPVSQFSFPSNARLALLPNGDLAVGKPVGALYVIRSSDNTVHQVPFDAATVLSALPPSSAPTMTYDVDALAAFPDGTLAAAIGSTNANGRLVRIDPTTGDATTIAAPDIVSLATLPGGDVAAVSGARLLRISPDGGVTVLAEDGLSLSDGPLTDMETRVPSASVISPLGTITSDDDGNVVVANTAVARVEVVHPGTATSVPTVDVHVGPSSGSDVTLRWSASGLPSGATVRITTQLWPQAAPVSPWTAAVEAPASDGTATVTGLVAGQKYAVSTYVMDGADTAGTTLSPAASIAVVVPGDATAPFAPNSLQVLATGTSAQLSWQETLSDVDSQTVRIAPGSVPPGPGEGSVAYTGLPSTAQLTGLTPGTTYSVSVTATDYSGNESPAGTLTFVAGQSPRLTVTGPLERSWHRTDQVVYHLSTDTPATLLCTIDGVEYDCLGGTLVVPVSAVSTGMHTVRMTPQTSLGNGNTVTRHVGFDGDKPTARVRATLPQFTLSSSIRVPVAGHDATSGVASYDVRHRRINRLGDVGSWVRPAAWQRTAGDVTLRRVPQGVTECFEVRSRDRAGNTSAWSAMRCTITAFDDRAMSASAGWSRGAGSHYYDGTFTQTRTKGSRLKISRVAGNRVAIVATVCPTCGVVKITGRHGFLYRQIDLSKGAKTTRRVLIFVGKTGDPGTLRVDVLSSGRLVRIDAIAIGHQPQS